MARGGARLRRGGFRPRIWLLRHAQVALASLGRFFKQPLASLMTAAVIGIALAFPSGLHTLLLNLERLSGGWDGAATISLFLKREVEQPTAEALAGRLRSKASVASVDLIDRDSALAEFRRLSGFGDALDALEQNPLPIVLVIQPTAEQSTPGPVQTLISELTLLPESDIVQLDMQWVRRFQAMTRIAQRGVVVIATLLGLAVLLIVGNTIRLEIENRRAEIEVVKLFGATDAFIRRPFLYSGLWYGLGGGLIAWLLVAVAVILVNGPVKDLALLYNSGFDLDGLDSVTAALLLGGSALLGVTGSWLAVGRHLTRIEPA